MVLASMVYLFFFLCLCCYSKAPNGNGRIACYLINSSPKQIVLPLRYLWRCQLLSSRYAYISNTHQKFKKIMEGPFSDVQLSLKNGQKYHSFTARFEQHFKSNTPHTDLRKCTMFKVVK